MLAVDGDQTSTPPLCRLEHQRSPHHQRLLVRERHALAGLERGERHFQTGRPNERIDHDVDVRTPGQIQRINQRNVFILAGNLTEGASLGEAITETERIVHGLQLPAGVTMLPSTAAQSNRELQGSIVLLGALAVFLVFIVMSSASPGMRVRVQIVATRAFSLATGVTST